MTALAVWLAPAPAAAQAPPGGGMPVAARDLPRGAVLARGDVAGAGAAALEGWVTRRVIAEGEALREPAIARPELVASGEVVQVVWKDGPIELRLVGRAMGSGAKGDRVHVRVDSRRRFVGVVEGPALVRMDAGELNR